MPTTMELKTAITLNRTDSNGKATGSVNLYRGEPYFDGENLWINNNLNAENERQPYSFDGETPIAGPAIYNTLNPDIKDTRDNYPQYKLVKKGQDNHIGGFKIPTSEDGTWTWAKSNASNTIYFDDINIINSKIGHSTVENSDIKQCTVFGDRTTIDTCYLSVTQSQYTPGQSALDHPVLFEVKASANVGASFKVEENRVSIGDAVHFNISQFGTVVPDANVFNRGDLYAVVPGGTSPNNWKQVTFYLCSKPQS